MPLWTMGLLALDAPPQQTSQKKRGILSIVGRMPFWTKIQVSSSPASMRRLWTRQGGRPKELTNRAKRVRVRDERE